MKHTIVPRPVILAIPIACLLLVAGGAGWLWRNDPRSPFTASTQTLLPERRTIVSFGHVDVENGIVALSPTQAGRITEILAREGQRVEKNAPLLRVDDRLARLRVAEAQADLRAAERLLGEIRKAPEQHRHKTQQQASAIAALTHRMEAARLAAERKEEMSEKQLLSPKEAQAARELVAELQAALAAEREKAAELNSHDPSAAVERATHDAAAKQARLEQAELAVRECTLGAPADGMILRVLVGVGDLLGPQSRQPAMFFCTDGPRIIRAEIEQDHAAAIAVGQPATIEDDGRSGATWKARVARVGDWFTQRRSILLDPLQFNDVRTLECILEIEAGEKPVRIGQRVRVKFEVP
jgi:multidrug resistance efflux pump